MLGSSLGVVAMIVEHREHLRVNDRLIIAWRPASSNDLAAQSARDVMLLKTNQTILQGLSTVQQSDPITARALERINHKLDLVADDSEASVFGPSLSRVNLSCSGLAFEWSVQLLSGLPIRLTLTLPPANRQITFNATVLEPESTQTSSRPIVRCQFTKGQDDRLRVVQRYIDYMQMIRDEKNKLVAPNNGDTAGNQQTKTTPSSNSMGLFHFR